MIINVIGYLFVFSIAVCFEAFRGVQLDGAAANHLNATFLVFRTQRSHTAVYLRKIVKAQVKCARRGYYVNVTAFGQF